MPSSEPPCSSCWLAGGRVLLSAAVPFHLRETAFASWVGLRGAVPIYLSIIPGLADPHRDQRLFASIFILVIASLVVQGWTVAPATRVLGFGREPKLHR